MADNFITNSQKQKTLKGRLNTLISISDELKFLVGFFYFSGWSEIYKSLQEYPMQKLKLLVGLQVCKYMGNIIEYAGKSDKMASRDEVFQQYLYSLGVALNNEGMDTEEFYNQVGFFVQMIEEERLVIRKTENPNHAKLYLFGYNNEYRQSLAKDGQFVTGSSNLTRSGLHSQEEFNVEISDYGYHDALSYFDNLWEQAIPITEMSENRRTIIDFIKNKTQVATVTPFEAYCLVVKTYVELYSPEDDDIDMGSLLEKVGFKKFTYQIDAVKQAIRMIKEHNGCIVADVVGLGKSVIAAMIGRQLNKRGMVICPPALIGDPAKKDSGWWEYLEKFGLHDWQVFSRGKLDEIADYVKERNFEVVVVDEAHYFRNQDTDDYKYLDGICRGRQVILLTATPFNNSPLDIYALLKLFIIPGLSTISLGDNLKAIFQNLNYQYKKLSYIIKNQNAEESDKRAKAEQIYESLIGMPLPIEMAKVEARTQKLSAEIKRIIGPVVIRRNRLDLEEDYLYSKEVGELSKVQPPEELFFYLNKEQDEFYNQIVSRYFGSEDGLFSGAIYQPFIYEKVLDEKMDKQSNRQYNQQKNLFDFMRRLLVKRFESSFGSFEKSIERFLAVHKMVRGFIEETGKFILDRDFIERIKEFDLDEIEANLSRYAVGDLKRKTPKNNEVYEVHTFQRKKAFLSDIDADIELFERIKKQLEQLNMVNNDPKQDEIIDKVKELLKKKPDRKIILFSEYVDTIQYLEAGFRKAFGKQVLVCDGKMNRTLAITLNKEFNAQYSGTQTNQFKILLTSDKLSEGVNLNRAGVIINYDIPWNPTRVIQRVGRINRIGSKVYDELYILNFFPSLRGAGFVKSREIAHQKMFLIHNALGEDTQIFDDEEEPTPSRLSARINRKIDDGEEVNTITRIRNLYASLQKEYPEVMDRVGQLPLRVKTAKRFPQYELNILRRKGSSLFAQTVCKEDERNVREIDFEVLLAKIACSIDEPALALSDKFWGLYEKAKAFELRFHLKKTEQSIEHRAEKNLKISLKILKEQGFEHVGFIQTLIKDIRYYHTLPKRSLRSIGEQELTDDKEAIRHFLDQVVRLKTDMGEQYLEEALSRIKKKDKEVIIAIENNAI